MPVAEDDRGRGWDRLGEATRVVRLRAALLPEADRQHLAEAALDVGAEGGVRLDPPHHDDRVSLPGVAVHVARRAVVEVADLDRVHRRQDRSADLWLGDAVLGQDRALALGGRAAVAAHRRHDERLARRPPELLDDGPDDGLDVGDAPAAGRDRDALTRLDARSDRPPSASALADRASDVGQVFVWELLADASHPRQWRSRKIHRRPPGSDDDMPADWPTLPARPPQLVPSGALVKYRIQNAALLFSAWPTMLGHDAAGPAGRRSRRSGSGPGSAAAPAGSGAAWRTAATSRRRRPAVRAIRR